MESSKVVVYTSVREAPQFFSSVLEKQETQRDPHYAEQTARLRRRGGFISRSDVHTITVLKRPFCVSAHAMLRAVVRGLRE